MGKKGFSKKIPNGSEWVQNCGEVLTVIEFLGGVNFKVKFEDTEVFIAQHKEIRNGITQHWQNYRKLILSLM